MTGWDMVDKIMAIFPPILAVLLVAAAGVLFLIGFSRHGVNFIKYGFKQIALDDSIEKRFEAFDKRFEALDQSINDLRTEVKGEINGLRTELDMIKVNHFGHLKDFLTELTSILLDKGIINNTERARLDNKLRGM